MYIDAAYAGHVELLELVHGSGKKEDTINTTPPKGADGKEIKFSPKVFDVMFGDGPFERRAKRK